MAYRDLRTDGERCLSGCYMEDGKVLNIRPLTDANRVNVTSNDRIEPNTAMLSDLDVTDYRTALRKKDRCMDPW